MIELRMDSAERVYAKDLLLRAISSYCSLSLSCIAVQPLYSAIMVSGQVIRIGILPGLQRSTENGKIESSDRIQFR